MKSLIYLLGPEDAAVPWIALVGVLTTLLLAFVVMVARRRRNYASAAIPLIAAAYGGVALASGVAVWMFSRTLEEMARLGGGISSIAFGFWQAARVPLSASWIALAATLLAVLFVALSARNEPHPAPAPFAPWLAALTAAAGVGAVLLFRGAMAFVLELSIPGASPALLGGRSASEAVAMRLLSAGAGSAVCFAAAIALMIATLRRGGAPGRVVVAMLVVSLIVPTALVVNLGTYSDRWRGVNENGCGLHALLPERAVR
jgi:hypothetical protein